MYIAFDVGCIECGEASGLIGVYASKEEAEAAADAARKEQHYDWHGEHYMFVVDTDNPADYSTYAEVPK